MNCGLCDKNMEEREDCNPHPFNVDRVCLDCDSYVSATRIQMAFWKHDEETQQKLLNSMVFVIKTKYSLDKAINDLMKRVTMKEDLV